MEKIKISILSIIVILIFGDSTEGQAQYSHANESYRTSFISSTQALKDSTEKRLSSLDKIFNVPIGIVIGSLCGIVIGTAIPTDYSRDKIANFIKGGLIGASIGPFYTFEIMSMSKGVKNLSHKWYFTAGGNLTLANHAASQTKPGYSIGIGRQYHLTDRIGLRGEVSYTLREFFLPSQKISYSYHYFNEIRYCDIDFSVGYIDISLLLHFKLFRWRKSTLSIALGPSLAIEVLDNTRYHLIKVEADQNDFDFIYIDDEPDPLFGYPAMVYQLELQSGKWIWQFEFHNSVTDTDEIYPLISNTRLRTFKTGIGYILK